MELYVPAPLWCFKYQKFGHDKNTCRGQQVCGKCGESNLSHTENKCGGKKRCSNCYENHSTFSKTCGSYQKEKEIMLYHISRLQSSVTVPIIPGLYPALDYGTKYNPSGSQSGLNDNTYGTPLPQPCPPPSNLSATARKNRSKVSSRKVTIHGPASRCDSLKEGPMTTSERKRVYRQLKTEIRRVYVVKQKKYNSDFCRR